MALKVKRIRRVAVAVLDIEAALERYKMLFNIDPFDWGEEAELKYKWVAFRFGSEGDNQCSMEFLSPMNDPDGEVLIGKFIKKKGEGLYMVTLEMEEDNKTFEVQLNDMGITASWGNANFTEGPGLHELDRVLHQPERRVRRIVYPCPRCSQVPAQRRGDTQVPGLNGQSS